MVRGLASALCALFVLATCGGSESPVTPPTPPKANAARAPTPPLAPSRPAGVRPPTAKSPEAAAAAGEDLRGDPARGAALYAQYCTTCHGERGHGDGPASAAMNPRPADHTDPVRMGALSDAALYTVIQRGGVAVGKSPLMSAWGQILDDSQIRDLIGFLRQLSGT